MNKVAPMTVTCPTCGTGFPVDPDRVPVEGVLAICSVCSRAFRVERPAGWVSLVAPPSFDHPGPEFEHPGPEEGPGGAGAYPGDEGPDEVAVSVDEAVAEEPDFQEDVSLEEQPPVWDAPAAEADVEVEEELAVAEDLEVEEELPAETDFTVEAEVDEPAAEREGDAAVQVEDEPAPEPVSEAPGQDTWTPLAGGTTADVGTLGVAGSAVPDEEGATTGRARFGFRDPANRARRLARVLSSDMITYNPARYADARRNGSLREDFRDEIEKSWEEYVDQVGEEFAISTHHFTDALNEVLAQGEKLFEGPGFPF
jgi:predicted Zn finger-like uncharacterized protein